MVPSLISCRHTTSSSLPSPHKQGHDCQLRRDLLPDYSSASMAASGTFRKLPGFQDSCLAPAFYAEKCVCPSLETGDYHRAGRRSSTQKCPSSLGPFSRITLTEGLPPTMMEKMTSKTISLAAIIISVIPVLMFFPFVRKNFQSGIMVGSLKG